jgi:nuclear RNA export factor
LLEHDDRSGTKTSDIKRRVSFKTNTRHSRGGMSDNKLRAFLDDEEMSGEIGLNTSDGTSNVGKKSNFRNRRKGSPIPRYSVGGGGRLIQSPSGWYQVIVQHGSKYQKQEILTIINNALSPDAFNPLFFKVDEVNRSCFFYVDDHNIAEKILKQDRKLDLPDGFKMILKVRSSVPQTNVNDDLKNRMKIAMGKRFNVATKALDLTKFHADPDFTDCFCALARPPIMSAVIDIIAENIPDLEALNLNDNRINQMDHLKIIPQKLKNIKTLYLGNNKVKFKFEFLLNKNVNLSFFINRFL